MILTLFVTGLAVGLFSSLLGLGGGTIMIPILHILFPEMSAQSILSCSLGVILINATVNSYNFRRAKFAPDMRLILFMGIAAVVGALIGCQLINAVSQLTVNRIFAAVIFVSLIRTLVQKEKQQDGEAKGSFSSSLAIKMAIAGFIGGLASGLTGLGGGMAYVPLMLAFSVPIALVPVYSNSTMVFSASAGIIGHLMVTAPQLPATMQFFQKFQLGNVNFLVISGLLAGSLISSRFGIKLVRISSPAVKKYLFALILLAIIVKILLFS